jgi:hypothetical protein
VRRLVPFVLLAFSAGGALAPAVHRAVHAAEASAERTAHEKAGHHHHVQADVHGVEWTPPCDEPVTLDDLACVLCKGLSTGMPASTPVAFAASDDVLPAPTRGLPTASLVDGTAPARGPPHRIA